MIDSHAHIQDDRYDDIDNFLEKQKEFGVKGIVCASSSFLTSKQSISLAEQYDFVFATVGVHPEEAEEWNEQIKKEIMLLARNKKCVAIGEIGLDYYNEFCSREKQKIAFVEQIEIANQLKMPIVIHSRDASGDMMQIIRENLSKLKNGVVFHCFNMSNEILKEIMGYGFYISIGGVVTFKNARNVLDIARLVDDDKYMLETDSPYLSPEPFRGKLNEPKNVEYVAKKIAELKEKTLEEVIKETTDNAKKFFKI